jgi:hypothetical protein
MEAAPVVDESCAVFGGLPELEPQAIHRFVVGEDQAPRTLSADEAEAELGDPFATLLLLQGNFPHSAIATLKAIDQATSADDPLRQQMSFVLGEGSQLDDPELATDGLRFLVARGDGPQGPDLIVSAFAPEQEDGVELMSWDRARGGFNFYRTVGSNGAWVFAGNSRHAVLEGTEGKGPFESHASGNLLMKELKTPWINWDSPAAPIPPTIFPEGDARVQHAWFAAKELQGAITCEAAVARPSIQRWTEARFEAIVGADGAIERPARIIEQILTTPTANLVSSHIESDVVASKEVDLPVTFFVDAEGLAQFELPTPPGFTLQGALYAQSLQTFEVHLSDGRGFDQPRDTHFAFVVPERAAEDQAVLQAARESGLISDRLAASLLMTDFPNPIFSERRASLMSHVPTEATIADGVSGFSEEMANAILAAADASGEGSAEREFAERWAAGDAWREQFTPILNDYYAAVQAKLADQEAFNDYFRLAESRRKHFRKFPIGKEFKLLFSRSNVPEQDRAMQSDGTVVSQG